MMRINIELKNQELENKSGRSGIWAYTRAHDYGVIAAHRRARDYGLGPGYTRKENRQRSLSLYGKLRKMDYGVATIRGYFIENYGSKLAMKIGKNLFFVVDVKGKRPGLKHNLVSLGAEFGQDCVFYGEADAHGVLISTNHSPINPLKWWGRETMRGGVIFGLGGEFLGSFKSRPFVFDEHIEDCLFQLPVHNAGKRGPARLADIHWSEIDPKEWEGYEIE